MRRYLLLTLALLLLFAVQMVPQGDLFDGDGGTSVAVLSKSHLHTPSCTRAVRLAPPRRLLLAAQAERRAAVMPEAVPQTTISNDLVFVLRC